MSPKVLLSFLLPALFPALLLAGPSISVDAENPNYFFWRGKPTVLVSATEHYGSAINPAFDYAKYLETLARDGLNATMVMSGAFIEGGLGDDSLQPPAGKALIPWARSETPGYVSGGNKFDLSRFDENYFTRLKAMVDEAGRRGVVVWYVFFTPFFDDYKWKASPWNSSNYVNGPQPVASGDLFKLERNDEFIAIQESLIRRVVETLRDADNVIYEPIYDGRTDFCEPRWLDHITAVIADAQKSHPSPKLISRNFGMAVAKLESVPAGVSVLAWKMSEAAVAANNWNHHHPVAHTESGFVPTNDAFSRMRAWDFIFSGGAAFVHMDWTMQTPDPAGLRAQWRGGLFGGGPVQRRELGALNRFVHSLDISRLEPMPDFVASKLPVQVLARTLSEKGRRRYVTYLSQEAPSGRASVRWTGKLLPRFSEEYTLTTKANDGVRVWIDGKPVIDAWKVRGTIEDSGRVRLRAGAEHDLKIEFFFNDGSGGMEIAWESPSVVKATIPETALRTPRGEVGIFTEHFKEVELGELLHSGVEKTVTWKRPPVPVFPVYRHIGEIPLQLAAPAGNYAIEWLEPATLRPLWRGERQHAGGVLELTAPPFADDVLLSLKVI